MDGKSSLETLCKATIIARENMEDSSEDERYMIADLDAMDCMMDRGMDDENGAVEDDEDDDGSDTEADDADLVDCFFDDKEGDQVQHSDDDGGDGSHDSDDNSDYYGGYDPAVIYL
ncbi:Oidioi.mRNA.OKI2018_I69.PAR.g10353.t1.cds [Oikopleura dioica]|uniref:Oidioi.mRNA.OKI2018_I69.PAR.g10353.t1.cds n=1 Tax=Oikopleura dioica TaxID=34765 RepID=A0ABN7RXW0_OIKDI|nr:Oidioi.mRNA.OKI2018_I69.PAR.g10353.t1.cds [Oikopleura dioica]